MAQAAHDLGTENLLVVPGAVHIPWRDDHEPVPNDVCDRRAREAVGKLVPTGREAEGLPQHREHLLQRLPDDADGDERLRRQLQERARPRPLRHRQHHAVPVSPSTGSRSSASGSRTSHFKEFTKKGTDHSLESFRPLLDGTTNWPAVMEALDEVGYRGYLTFEYFHPYPHYPEALIYQTSDSLDRMLGRKG